RHTRSKRDWSSDVCSSDLGPVETALAALHRGGGGFFMLVGIFAAGIGIGLLGLVYFNGRLFGRVKNAPPAPPKTLAMMIATGLRSEERRVGKERRCQRGGE